MIPAAPFEGLREASVARPSAAHARQQLDAAHSLLSDTIPILDDLVRKAARGPDLIEQAARDLIDAGGKRVRPLATLLTAKACGGEGRDAAPLAAAVELVHSATLLHDDVIDEGEERRGRPATRVQWGNLVSVLSGDLLLTSALGLIEASGIAGAMSDLIATMHALIAGEVAQFKARGRDDLGVTGYLEIVRGKTGSLFAMACRSGARSAFAAPEIIEAAGRFGERVGVAFQIVDDVLDLEGVPHEVGKRLGADLAEGKTTLPLALALQDDAARLRPLLINARAGDIVAASQVARAERVRRACIEARAFAARETELGLRQLKVFPLSRERTLLELMVHGLANRTS
ncbi:MAG: polyprenyl synthetase family protein [Proteobacteria bacterium]|nr:polyprenyl synthetase family protein [Pseudomonadota bacterium]